MKYTISKYSSSDPFDDFWADTRGTELELEQGDDDCEFDSMTDEDE